MARVTEFGPPMWQAEADKELTLSASPATAVGHLALTLVNRLYSTLVDINVFSVPSPNIFSFAGHFTLKKYLMNSLPCRCLRRRHRRCYLSLEVERASWTFSAPILFL